jgi:hypothetical protein
MAAGQAVTLDVAGDGLLNVTVDTGAVNALVSNGGMIRADGGQVVLTAQAAGQLLKTVVNNTGVIEARTLQHREGRILLLADMNSRHRQCRRHARRERAGRRQWRLRRNLRRPRQHRQ